MKSFDLGYLRSRAAESFRRFPAWLLIVAALSVAAVAFFLIESLHESVLSRETSRVLTNDLEANVAELHVAEYAAALGEEVTPELATEISDERSDIAGNLDDLERLNPGDEKLAQVRESLSTTEAALDEQMRLIEEGQLEAAHSVDEEQVDPGFETLDDDVGEASARYEDSARRAELISEAGISLTVLLGTSLIVALFWRYVRARKAARKELEQTEERFRSLVQNSLDVVTVTDAGGNFLYLSPSIETVMGYEPEEFIGKNALETVTIHPDDTSHVRKVLAYLVENPGADCAIELRMRHADSSWRVIDATSHNLLDDPSVGGIVTNYRDVTERKAFEEQLEHRAFHDDLTGLPNRALLMDHLEQALARVGRHRGFLAVLFLDLDNFKVINDSLGHKAGDELLVAAARRLQECLRPADTMARLSGDEFVLLLEDITEETQATRLAERLVRQLQTPFEIAGRDVHVATSIGIAYGTSSDVHPDDLLRNADLAMYRAKSRGKAHHEVFHPDMEAQAHERLKLEGDLRLALERGEFRLHYQPKVVLKTGEVMGVEALIRWEHPERGLVSPAEFVPLAEETGLIVPIGKWVVEEACRQAREWREERLTGPPIVVNVNLSARQFKHPLLVDEISRALEKSGLEAGALTLEITETVMMESGGSLIHRLEELKSLGIRLAMDDFGTGYSSLSYLTRFPLDYLKIDRSFTAGLDESERNVVLVSAMINLAKTLGLRVVAEGVETEGQLLILRTLGCELGQGYYFSRPLPAGAVPSLLDSGE